MIDEDDVELDDDDDSMSVSDRTTRTHTAIRSMIVQYRDCWRLVVFVSYRVFLQLEDLSVISDDSDPLGMY